MFAISPARALLLALAVALASSAQATMTEYQRTQVTRHLHGPKLTPDPAIFDGAAFNPSADPEAAAAYVDGYVEAVNRAAGEWKKLTSSAKASAEGQALLAELNEKIATAKAMRAALPAFQAARAGGGATAPAQAPVAGGGAAADSGTAPAAAPAGTMTAYQQEQITRHLDSGAMREDRAIFDGKEFVAGVSEDAFEQYYRGYVQQLNQAVATWERQIPAAAKATPEGTALRERLVRALAWGKAMQARYPAARQVHAERRAAQAAGESRRARAQAGDDAVHKRQCADFQSRAMTPLAREPMTRLIGQMLHGNQSVGSPEGVERHAGVAAEVRAVCGSVDRSVLAAKPCWYVLGRPEHDPLAWCKAAEEAPVLIRAMALASARQVIGIVGSSTIQSEAQFMQREGWLTFEGPVSYQARLHFAATGREQVMDTVTALLNAAGVADADDALWGEQKQRVDALRSSVDRTAGSWKSPPRKAENYSGALARAQVVEMHPEAEVLDAWLGRASWKIHKNALGVPLRRTMPGYVLFKLPADPHCQLRSYTLTEDHMGGGRYQEARGVRIGYVRFQDCP